MSFYVSTAVQLLPKQIRDSGSHDYVDRIVETLPAIRVERTPRWTGTRVTRFH